MTSPSSFSQVLILPRHCQLISLGVAITIIIINKHRLGFFKFFFQNWFLYGPFTEHYYENSIPRHL